MVAAARTIRKHWHGVLRWFTSKITNGLLEGTYSSQGGEKRLLACIELGSQHTYTFVEI
jgi:hypothetical protein